MSAAAILAIDAGNTRIKWGVFADAWMTRGAVPTAEAPRLAEEWRALPRPLRAIASNVAGPAIESALRTACEGAGAALTLAHSRHAQLGLTSDYDAAQLGPDRWAALVAAHHAGRGHKLVVNAGTALTIDALRADGRFLGGLIVAGPALMRRALDRGTARLRETDGAFEPFPKRTPDAITTGAIQASIGAIERMAAAMAQAGCAPDTFLLSGGAAGELAPHLPRAAVLNENLVLDGLVLIAREA